MVISPMGERLKVVVLVAQVESVHSNRMIGGYLICMEMCMNGAWIISRHIVAMQQIPRALKVVFSVFAVVGAGMVVRRIVGRQNVLVGKIFFQETMLEFVLYVLQGRVGDVCDAARSYYSREGR